MSFIGTVIVGTDPLSQFLGREQAIWLDDSPLPMDPLGFNRIEPRTLGRQKEGQNTHAFALSSDLLVVVANPGAHNLAVMPRGIIPNQQPGAFTLNCQIAAAPVQKLCRDVAHRTAIDKAQRHLVPHWGISWSSLPQHAITRQRLGIGVVL